MQTVVATFDDKQMAQRAVSELTANGFSRESIHLQTPAAMTSKGEAHGGFMAEVEHFFANLFGSDSDDETGNYAEAVRRGSAVVAVDAPTDADLQKAKTVMQGLGSFDVDARAPEWKNRGWEGFDPDSKPLNDEEQAQERQAVPVVKEEIRVGKRMVDTGGLRVVKRMTEVPVSQIINLREERATVERRPVDREATEGDFSAFKEGTVEIREKAEEPVVGKTARVVEEVVVGKEVSEHPETVSDTVRRTDVDVERVDDKKTRSKKARAPRDEDRREEE